MCRSNIQEPISDISVCLWSQGKVSYSLEEFVLRIVEGGMFTTLPVLSLEIRDENMESKDVEQKKT